MSSVEREGDAERLEALRQQLRAESSDGLKLLKSVEDNPVCSVRLDESVPCVHVVWKRYVTSTQLRFVHEHILRLIRTHRVRAVLGDDTQLPTIHGEDQRWIVEDWMPRARAVGLKAGASKRPASYFGKLAVNSVQKAPPSGVQLRSFEKMEEARGWLMQVAREG